MVKHEDLLHGFELAKTCDLKLLNIIGDSNLIVMQVKEKFARKNEGLNGYGDAFQAMEYFIPYI